LVVKKMTDGKTIGRYFSVFACIGLFYSLYSYSFDLIFHKMEYKGTARYIGAMGGYLLAYFVFFYISLPIALFYNSVVNILLKRPQIRIIFGIICGAIMGYAYNGLSYYIGEHRRLKNLIAMVLVGLSLEILRVIIVRRREHKKLHHESID